MPDGSSGGTTTGFVPPQLCLEHGYPGVQVSDAFQLADVDGDGVDELWRRFPAVKPGMLSGARGYVVEDLELSSPSVWFEFEADTVAIADIDGDGHDDLVRTWMGALEYRRGEPGPTFAEAFVPIAAAPGPAPRIYVDIDGDGDDDGLSTITTPEGLRLSVHTNGAGARLSVVAELIVPGNTIAQLERADRVAGTPWLVVDLEWSLVFLDVDRDVQLVGSLAADARFLGGYAGEQGPVGFVFVVDDAAVDQVEFHDGVLQTTRVLEDVLDAAVADFEGLGSPQILYRTEAELLLRRVEQDVEFTVGLDREQDTFALPWGPANFGPGAGVLARACGFICEFIPARLVDC